MVQTVLRWLREIMPGDEAKLRRRREGGMQVNAQVSAAVQDACRRYEQEVEASNLARNTKHTYLLHAGNFVRWLRGDFTPGATLR